MNILSEYSAIIAQLELTHDRMVRLTDVLYEEGIINSKEKEKANDILFVIDQLKMLKQSSIDPVRDK